MDGFHVKSWVGLATIQEFVSVNLETEWTIGLPIMNHGLLHVNISLYKTLSPLIINTIMD